MHDCINKWVSFSIIIIFQGYIISFEVCIQRLFQLKLRTSINALMNCILLPSPHHPHPNPTHTNASLHSSCQLLTLTSLRKHHSSFNGIEYAKPRQSCDPLNLWGYINQTSYPEAELSCISRLARHTSDYCTLGWILTHPVVHLERAWINLSILFLFLTITLTN